MTQLQVSYIRNLDRRSYQDFTMSKLPSEIPPQLQHFDHLIDAYNKCLDIEASIQRDIDSNVNVGRKMIYCRILGYLILHSPNDQAVGTVVGEIVACEDYESLLTAGQNYYNHFILPCKYYCRCAYHPDPMLRPIHFSSVHQKKATDSFDVKLWIKISHALFR